MAVAVIKIEFNADSLTLSPLCHSGMMRLMLNKQLSVYLDLLPSARQLR
jgi:hypothetical protein